MTSLWLILRRIRQHRVAHYGSEQQLGIALLRSLLYLLAIFVAHIVAMRLLEGMSIGDALWLTLTTVTTVGYGDISPATWPGRTATAILLYGGGIFVLAKTAGDYFDYRSDRRERRARGNWEWRMRNLILIINTPDNHGERYFSLLVDQLTRSREYQDHMVQILTSQFPDGLPPQLANLDQLVHYNGSPPDPHSLAAVNADHADAIIILAKQERNPASDSRTFDILHRLSDLQCKGRIVAECVDDANRERLKRAGAHIVIRPVRAYPEMVVRGLVAPGSEQVIENMFTSANDEYQRFDIARRDVSWSDIVCALVSSDIGTAMAYVDATTGSIVTNPPAHQRCDVAALIVVVREDRDVGHDDLDKALTP